MTERDKLLAFALKRGLASEDEVIELLEDPDFYPDGFDEVDDKTGFFDDLSYYLCEAATIFVDMSKHEIAEILAGVLFGMEGAAAVSMYQRAMRCLS